MALTPAQLNAIAAIRPTGGPVARTINPVDIAKIVQGAQAYKNSGVTASDPTAVARQKIANSIAAIQNSDAPNSAKQQAADMATSKSHGENLLTKALNILTKPKSAVVAGVAHLIDPSRNFVKDVRHNLSTSEALSKADWFKALGNSGTLGKIAQFGIGLTGDIAADPLTYLAGSAGIEALGGRVGLADKAVAQAAEHSNAAVDALRSGDELTHAVELAKANDLKSYAGRLLQKGNGGVGGLSDAELSHLGGMIGAPDLKGGLYFNIPGTGRVGQTVTRALGGTVEEPTQIFLSRGAPIRGISQSMSNVGDIAKTSKMGSAIGDVWGGGEGQIKRAILNASSPEQAVRRKTILDTFRASTGSTRAYLETQAQELKNILDQADKVGVDPVALNNAVGGSTGAIADITAKEGGAELLDRAKQFEDSWYQNSLKMQQEMLAAHGADPAIAQSIIPATRDLHQGTLITDEFKQYLEDQAQAAGRSVGRKFGPGMEAKLVPGNDWNPAPGQTLTIAHPSEDMMRIVYDDGRNGKTTLASMTKAQVMEDPTLAKMVNDGTDWQQVASWSLSDRAGEYLQARPQITPLSYREVMADPMLAQQVKAGANWRDVAARDALEKSANVTEGSAHIPEDMRNIFVDGKYQQVPASQVVTEPVAAHPEGLSAREQVNNFARENLGVPSDNPAEAIPGFEVFNLDYGANQMNMLSQYAAAHQRDLWASLLNHYGLAASKDVPKSVAAANARIAMVSSKVMDASHAAAAAGDIRAMAELDKVQSIQSAWNDMTSKVMELERLLGSSEVGSEQARLLEHQLSALAEQYNALSDRVYNAAVALEDKWSKVGEATDNFKNAVTQIQARDMFRLEGSKAAQRLAQVDPQAIEQESALRQAFSDAARAVREDPKDPDLRWQMATADQQLKQFRAANGLETRANDYAIVQARQFVEDTPNLNPAQIQELHQLAIEGDGVGLSKRVQELKYEVNRTPAEQKVADELAPKLSQAEAKLPEGTVYQAPTEVTVRGQIEVGRQNIESLRAEMLRLSQSATADQMQLQKMQQYLDRTGQFYDNTERLINQLDSEAILSRPHLLDPTDITANNFLEREQNLRNLIDYQESELTNINRRVSKALAVAIDAEAKSWRALDSAVDDLSYVKFLYSRKGMDIVHTAVRDGFVSIARTMQAPADVADAMELLTKMRASYKGGTVLQYFDRLTRLFKAWTIANPGFIVRHGYTGMWMNYLNDVAPGSYRAFISAHTAFNAAVKAGADEAAALAAVPAEYRAAYTLVHQSRVMEFGGQTESYVGKLNSALGNDSKNILDRASRTPINKAWNYVNHQITDVSRGAAAMHAAEKNGTIAAIYDLVFKAHFNYEDVNQFEKQVMTRVSPFYIFFRKSIPAMVEGIFQNPKAFARVMEVKQAMEAVTPPEDIVPEWMRERLLIRTPFSLGGGKTYLMPDLPVRSLTAVTNPNELLGQINPLIKTPIELEMGSKFYFGNSSPFQGLVQVPAWMKATGLAYPMKALGLVQTSTDGKDLVDDKILYALEQFMPYMGKARRLLPTETRYQERLPTTVIDFLFGAGLRSNTTSDIRGEMSNIQQKLDAQASTLNKLGYGGYQNWSKQVATTRKPTASDVRPYLTLIQPKGGLGQNTPYEYAMKGKKSASQVLADAMASGKLQSITAAAAAARGTKK